MPALEEEIEDALAEGVDIRYLVSPIALEGDGSVRAVRCVEMELGEADDSGRRRPIPIPGSEVVFDAEQVIVAVGQRPQLDVCLADGRLLVSHGRLAADPVSLRCGDANVFAGGDAVTGPATLIEAIAAGQRAAQSIDIFLGGRGELPPDTGFASRSKPEQPEGEVSRVPIRSRCGHSLTFTEIVAGYTPEQACAEARRCLRCDLER